MKSRRIGLVAAAAAVLGGAAPAAAVQVGEIAALVPATPPTDPDRAAALRREAQELFSQPKQWKKAVRLLEQSASLRAANDAAAYDCLMYAGRIRAALGDMRNARVDFEKAAAHALARGAVVDAANAYIDAAHTAVALKDGAGARELVDSASLLAASPLLTEMDRNRLRARLDA
ncbi:MAG TPA: hypothetical protein VFZ69_00060 [Longimicrobiales bacterium]